MKKALCLWLSLLLLLLPLGALAEEEEFIDEEIADEAEETLELGGEDDMGLDEEDDYMAYWVEYDYKELTVGNPTPLTGKFFTGLWGGTTSDNDVQELLHSYNLVKWDPDLGHIRFDHHVVSGAVITDDAKGNRTYYLALQEDLKYSDETPITAWDYAFSLLLQIDPVIAELEGVPMDTPWLKGIDEYLAQEIVDEEHPRVLSGLRVLSDYNLTFTVKAEALPYFYELARMAIKPYPIHIIAPDTEIKDDGKGVYLTKPLEAEHLRQTILDPDTGYILHPQAVSGPFNIVGFDGTTAVFRVNDLYKGNEEGDIPRIWTLYYTLADNEDMIQQLGDGEFGLLNKATLSDTLLKGLKLAETQGHQYTMANYPRVGLTLLWFSENSPKMQELAVRQAFAYCLDRQAFVRDYVGPFGLAVDGFYGLGQWMYQAVSGAATFSPPLSENATREEIAAYEQAVSEFEELSLDGLTRYSLDVDHAIRLLVDNGWTLNEKGEPYTPGHDAVRYKNIDGELVGLSLTVAMPVSQSAADQIDEHFLPTLHQAGFEITTRFLNMTELEEVYDGVEYNDIDLIYLGENFSVIFDPQIFLPHGDGELSQVLQEVYELAQDMVHTEFNDPLTFLKKWITMQERITQTLPLIPVYSNVYFDFYTRELYNYDIANAVTWSDAIIPSYMSDPEYYDADRNTEIEEELGEMELLFLDD